MKIRRMVASMNKNVGHGTPSELAQLILHIDETGEEDESTIFSSRSKLYNFVKLDDGKKEWKERGLGTVKLNVKETDDGKTARFIMRAEGSHRVILNTPIKKEINVGDPQGGRPKGQYVYFSGTIDNKPQLELLQLKVSVHSLWALR